MNPVIENNDVWHLQLVSGQDVFGVVDDTNHELTNDGYIKILEPLTMMITQQGSTLARYLPYADVENNAAVFREEHVMSMNIVNTEMRRHYNLSRFFADKAYNRQKVVLDDSNVQLSGVIAEERVADGRVIHINNSESLN